MEDEKECKRYFWLRLYADFFQSMRIKLLRKHGADHVVIYIKMMLKALNTDGVLIYRGLMDSFAEELALDIDEDTATVSKVIDYLMASDLLEKVSEEEYQLLFMGELMGSETAATQRSRKHRAKKKTERNTDATQVQRECNTDATQVQRERDAEIEKSKRRDREEIEKEKKKKPPRSRYGEFNHVLLSDEEFNKLCAEYGEAATLKAIRKVDEYCERSGKTYKNYYLTLRNWGFTADRNEERKSSVERKLDMLANLDLGGGFDE